MPFSGNYHSFDFSTLKALTNTGAVYGLFKTDLPFRPDHYTCLYVGETNDLLNAHVGAVQELSDHWRHTFLRRGYRD